MSIVSIVGLGLGVAGAVKSVDGTSYNAAPLLQAALGMFIGCLGLMFAIGSPNDICQGATEGREDGFILGLYLQPIPDCPNGLRGNE